MPEKRVGPKTVNAWVDMADYLWPRRKQLQPWERGLVRSCIDRLAHGRDLSWRQAKNLRRIYRREVNRNG